jgi:4'-phosphopantetheinyl transferase
MIDIYHCKVLKELTTQQWEKYYSILPPCQIEKNKRFKKWEDRQSHLFGRLLLQRGLINLGYNENVLESIKTTNFNKPFINDSVDFSISHSKKYVICAISQKVSLGIDIEKKDFAFDISHATNIFSPNENKFILYSNNKVAAFFRLWTRKESLVKANGKGFFIQLDQINCLPDQVIVENKTWHIQDINLNHDYAVSLSTSTPAPICNYFSLDFYV